MAFYSLNLEIRPLGKACLIQLLRELYCGKDKRNLKITTFANAVASIGIYWHPKKTRLNKACEHGILICRIIIFFVSTGLSETCGIRRLEALFDGVFIQLGSTPAECSGQNRLGTD